jgi:hypothetical protein
MVATGHNEGKLSKVLGASRMKLSASFLNLYIICASH